MKKQYKNFKSDMSTKAVKHMNPDALVDYEVMGFFARTSFPAQAILTYTHVYEDGPSCIVELAGRLPAGNDVEALDILTVGDEGRVKRMAVYARIAT